MTDLEEAVKVLEDFGYLVCGMYHIGDINGYLDEFHLDTLSIEEGLEFFKWLKEEVSIKPGTNIEFIIEHLHIWKEQKV